MPIPKPTDSESQDEFLGRCHQALDSEFPDSDQRHAICMSAWREVKGEETKFAVGGFRFQISDEDRFIEEIEAILTMVQMGQTSADEAIEGLRFIAEALVRTVGAKRAKPSLDRIKQALEILDRMTDPISLNQEASLAPLLRNLQKIETLVREFAGNQGEASSYSELRGIEIFRSGEHTDSEGQARTFTSDDLKRIHANFQSRKVSCVPIKLGHSTPEFVERIAKALAMPADLLTGDPSNGFKGRASLGEVTELHTNGVLKATIRFANDRVAQLVKDNYFTQVSVELLRRPEDGIVLSGLALLGGERPAVKGLKGLQAATMLDDGTLPNEQYVGKMDFTGEEVTVDQRAPSQKVLGQRVLARADELGDKELIWEIPVQEQQGNFTKTVSVIHHRAPAREIALREVIDAVALGMREAFQILGQGAGGLAVLILGRKVLFGLPFLARAGSKVRLDSTADILQKVRSAASKFQEGIAPTSESFYVVSREDLVRPHGIKPAFKDPGQDVLLAEFGGGICMMWKLTYNLSGESQTLEVIAASEEEAKAQAPEGATDVVATKMETPAGDATAMMAEVARSLGLKGRVTKDQILESIAKLQGSVAKFSEQEFHGLKAEVEKLRRKDRIATYREQTEPLTLIKGTPLELATKLTDLEEKAGLEMAKSVLTTWQETQRSAAAAGALVPVLNARHYQEDNTDLEAAVDKYQEGHPDASRGEAYKAVMLKRPQLRANKGNGS